MTAQKTAHIPVMLEEVLNALAPKDGGVYIDGTFGAGGYTRAILKAADCTVYAIDRDPDAVTRAKEMATEFGQRLVPLHGCFGSMGELMRLTGVTKVDGIVLDVGVSSIQLAEKERGFSFQHDGPLDMRMGKDGQSAADIVNTADEKTLADILFRYGEEPQSRRIAKKIVAARAENPVTTTRALANIVHAVLPMHGGRRTDTATKTFQALRIFVNDELGELERALTAAEDLLLTEGRLVVVSFHSLEDGLVKKFLKEKSGRSDGVSRHMPLPPASAPPSFRLNKNGGQKPSAQEVARNPRARSAHLRYAIRTDSGVAHA